MTSQACPNCHRKQDVAVYVTGQRAKCVACGINFEVKRTDVASRLSQVAVPGTFLRAAATVGSPGAGAVMAAAPGGGETDRYGAGSAQTVITPPIEKMDLPGYELLEVLGRGGMGEVWKARQRSLGRIVAVKVLPSKLAKDQEFVTRFDKEATALASLNHPNIIQIIDRGVAGTHYFFAMEFVNGRSLREVMSNGRMPPVEALKLITQICRAIDYAHEAGIIHRDLKPENILIDDRGQVKVADFGLAGVRGAEKLQLTATRVAMGTVNYMAPEQRKDAKNVDGRADLFSLGVMLYELLTGELPIGRFRPPSEKVGGLDLRLDEIVSKTLEPEPEHRYQRASDIGHALESMISTAPAVVSPALDPSLPAGEGVEGELPNTFRERPRVPSQAPVPSSAQSVVRSGWQGLKTGLAVVGALAVIALGARLMKQQERAAAELPELPAPPNTDQELFVIAQAEGTGASAELSTFFAPSSDEERGEELNAHAGDWRLADGRLRVRQAGNEITPGKLKLVPRAYFAHRYFSADDFTLDVILNVKELEPGHGIDADTQRFAEAAFRIRDLQVSAFAIPGVGMRMGWRYYTPGGEEIQGNSSRDVTELTEDEMPVPMGTGPFRVTLKLRRMKGGVEASAYVNNQRFARKILPGLEGQVGKIALGCRNLQCEFSELQVKGTAMKRPELRAAAPATQE